ncbi:MAG: hypothetical protein M1821_006904 [Bathelium mastoideum]|nr:MAG: hypothetical protein M1821_006904 [Bathelium mastoideum]
MRGPRRHQAPIPKQILEGLRYTSMIQALQYRKASFLGSQDWSTVPWQFSSKDSRQKLYDIGFQLAATIEGVDRLAEVQNASEKALTSSRSLSQLAQIDSNLDNWYRGLCQEYNVLCWMLPPSNPQTPDLNDPSSMQTLVFPDMDRAHVMTAFWTLKLTMSMIINQMCVRFTAEAQADDLSPSTTIFHEAASTSTLPSRPSSIPSTPSQLAHFVRATAQAHNAQHRLDLTANIVRSVPYFLRDEMGLMPAHMILWPIRVALYELQDSQPGIDYLSQETLQQSTATAQGPASVYNLEKQRLSKVSSALYDHLIEVKGLGYARQVGRAGRRWGRPMPSDVDKQIESSPTDPTAESNSSKTPQGQQDLAGQGRGNDADADFRASWKAVQRQATSQRPEFTSPVAERYRGV